MPNGQLLERSVLQAVTRHGPTGMASIHNLPLEGDGIAENLYQYLWTKDELDDGPRICIPDTIVYKYRQPAAWYFTSVVDGSIKKKNKANLINVRIEEAFLRKRSGSDIVAYYIWSNNASREEGAVAACVLLVPSIHVRCLMRARR